MKKVRDLESGVEYDFNDKTKKVYKISEGFCSNGRIEKYTIEYEYDKNKFSEPYEVDYCNNELSKLLNSI